MLLPLEMAFHDVPNSDWAEQEIHPDQDFGFLLTSEGGLLYFHRNSLLSGDFDALVPGQQLYYVEGVGDTGPLATKARVK